MAPLIKKVGVIGVGMMGTQIAIQAACYGCEVKVFDEDPTNFQKTLQRLRPIAHPTVSLAEWEKAAEKVVHCGGMREALGDVDLAMEAIFENLEAKRTVFAQMNAMTPPEAILATNSSSIPISKIESATTRPERCVNLHFYVPAGVQGYPINIVDVCGGTRTTAETIETCRRWVRSVGCIPLTVKKEVLGFCFNSVWRAVKKRCLDLWAEGYVDFRDIDRAWMVFTQMPEGPFGLMDMVGIDVIYDVEMSYYNESRDKRDFPPQALKDMIGRGELGRKTGKGFYSYPHPEFAEKDFLMGTRSPAAKTDATVY
jgi:3-hydroxybutyryl-CoA dehydrogenase